MTSELPSLDVLGGGLAEAMAEVSGARRGGGWLIGRWEPSAWNRRAEDAAVAVFSRKSSEPAMPWRVADDFRGRLPLGADLIESLQRMVMRGAIVHVAGVDGRVRMAVEPTGDEYGDGRGVGGRAGMGSSRTRTRERCAPGVGGEKGTGATGEGRTRRQ